jgi:hypothetical protein
MSTSSSTNKVDEIKEVMDRPRFVAAMIECTLRGVGQEIAINPAWLTIRPKGIHEMTSSRVLSDHVCNLMQPHVPGGDFFHYTKIDGFSAIMRSGVEQLAAIRLALLFECQQLDRLNSEATKQNSSIGYPLLPINA